MRTAAFVAALTLATIAPSTGRAQQQRVPLLEGFPVGERIALGVVVAADLALYGAQQTWLADRAPRATAPPAFDREVSDALYRGRGAGQFWGGAPDLAGRVVAPALGVYYLTDTLLQWRRGYGFAGDVNADHELLALFEALAGNMLFNQSAKLAVGRLRPEYALGRRPEDDPRGDPESAVSFYSMHASTSFCAAGFVARDLGDWLAAERLAAASPAVRFVLARLLPFVGLYGAASIVALSRVVDQKHYLSDVLVGAALGAASGNLVYAAHFDGRGQARRRPWRFGLVVSPGAVALRSSF